LDAGKRRLLWYGLAAVVVVGAVVMVNRPGPKVRQPVMDVDPKTATHKGPHAHEKLGTACLCDPDKEIKQALQDRADFAETHRALGDRFYARGQYQYALGRYQRAVELDKTNALAHYGMGLAYAKLGNYAKAEEAVKQAADLSPALAEPRISLGILAYRAGDFENARRHWETALKLDAKNDYAKLLLGRLPRLTRFEVRSP
jgi:tetratricopeptide (TPR) repeat protein